MKIDNFRGSSVCGSSAQLGEETKSKRTRKGAERTTLSWYRGNDVVVRRNYIPLNKVVSRGWETEADHRLMKAKVAVTLYEPALPIHANDEPGRRKGDGSF